MQPYLFPYLGYYQLIHAVDVFVIFDDVNYINRRWINRNYMLAQGKAQLFTLGLKGASQNKLINEISVDCKPGKLLETIRHNYRKAPHFATIFPLIEKILLQSENNLALHLDYGLRKICDYLGIHPMWRLSSKLKKNNTLRGQQKIIAICRELGISHYINVPGGKELYDKKAFENCGLKLSFIEPKEVSYRQFNNQFVPNLSIIDVMMFNDKKQCASLLEEYRLV